jgi:hypothetical protein
MIEIPRLEKRLEIFQWKLQLESSVTELRQSLASLASACDEVKSSKRLPVLLKVNGPPLHARTRARTTHNTISASRDAGLTADCQRRVCRPCSSSAKC